MTTLITDIQQCVGLKLVDAEYMKKNVIVYDMEENEFVNHIASIRNCNTIIDELEENYGQL